MIGDSHWQREHQSDRDDHPDGDLDARFLASRASPRRPDLTFDRMDRPTSRPVHDLFEARQQTVHVNHTGAGGLTC